MLHATTTVAIGLPACMAMTAFWLWLVLENRLADWFVMPIVAVVASASICLLFKLGKK